MRTVMELRNQPGRVDKVVISVEDRGLSEALRHGTGKALARTRKVDAS